MKKNNIHKASIIKIAAIALTAVFILTSCGKDNDEMHHTAPKPEVYHSGKVIKFPENSNSLKMFKVDTINIGSSVISASALGKVVATVSREGSNGRKLILFDTQDMTTLYSQYKQNKENIKFYSQDLARVQDMYRNQSITSRELHQAESELNIAITTGIEIEGKIRNAGFNPNELAGLSSKSAWMICDVPEAIIYEVQTNEEVDIRFNAFPEITIKGRVKSIGDLVDPASRTTKVRLILDNYKSKLIPGMVANVDFGEVMNDVITLPNSAIVTVDGKDYVFVQERDNLFRRKEVMIKKSNSGIVVITSGLNPGEKVVVKGAFLLKGLSFGY